MMLLRRIKQLFRAGRIYLFDLKKDICYSTMCANVESYQEMLLSSLVVAAHTIEKGLTMPYKHFPFGENKIGEIVDGCNKYIRNGYDIHEPRFQSVIGVLLEYRNMCNHSNGWGIFRYT